MAIILVLIAFFLTYRPTMFDFLIADDVYHITWLYSALNSPELVLTTYWIPWFGSKPHVTIFEPTIFYRPLYMTLLFFLCKLIGIKSLFFRLVNMCIELLSGLMLSLVVIALKKMPTERSSLVDRQFLMWGLFSGALFVLFPLHSGVVNWIAVGTDPIVTLFSLLSIWCYIQWRNKSRLWFFILSISSAILVFLTKEMAAALPPIIFLYELLCVQGTKKNVGKLNGSMVKALHAAFVSTLPYWLILATYLCFRKAFLGDFIAGYPDGMYSISISGWLNGLRDIFVPINTLVVSTHSYIFKLWHVFLFIVISLSLIATFRANNDSRKKIYFLAAWFILAIAPTYKAFPAVMDCVLGSRLGYLATAPVCALLTYGLAIFSAGNRFLFLFRLTAIAWFVLAARLLYTNNLAWAEAGHWTNKVVQEFKDYYKDITGDPPVYVTGLPMISKKGVYSLWGLNGITKKPIMDRDLSHCMRLDFFEHYVSTGFVKDEAVCNPKQTRLLYWDSQSEILKPVVFSPPEHFTKQWRDSVLQQMIYVSQPHSNCPPKIHWLSDGTLEVTSNLNKIGYVTLELKLPALSCGSVDFLGLNVQFTDCRKFGAYSQAEFIFRNNIATDYSKRYLIADHCDARIISTNSYQDILFPLRDMPAWTMGGTCSSAKIILPIEHALKIKGIFIPDTKTLMPFVYLNSSTDDIPGQFGLDNKGHSIQYVKYDARSVGSCKKVILEITRASNYFEVLSSKGIGKEYFLERNSSSPYGQFMISRNEFPAEKTTYRARLRALDRYGNQIGFPSDTVFIHVDS